MHNSNIRAFFLNEERNSNQSLEFPLPREIESESHQMNYENDTMQEDESIIIKFGF